MSPEQVIMKLNDICPSDFPDERSWERVLEKFPDKDPALLDLDSIQDKQGRQAIIITKGSERGYSARNGNHTLARIAQLFGDGVEVTFTPNTELRDWHQPGEFQKDVDWRVSAVANWGVSTFVEFLEKCLEGEFYKSETNERPLW